MICDRRTEQTEQIGKLFPRYRDDAEYNYFCQVNEAMEELSDELSAALSAQGETSVSERFLPLRRYIAAQYLRTEKNQNVEYYGHDLEEYRELLEAAAVLKNREDRKLLTENDRRRLVQLKEELDGRRRRYGMKYAPEMIEGPIDWRQGDGCI